MVARFRVEKVFFALSLFAGALAHGDECHEDCPVEEDPVFSGFVLTVLGFTLVIVVITMIPIFVPFHDKLSELTLSLVRCFSGGVFLSMGLYHLLADATIEFRKVDLGNYQDGFALILAMVGYFILFGVEQVWLGDLPHNHGFGGIFSNSQVSPTNETGVTFHAKPQAAKTDLELATSDSWDEPETKCEDSLETAGEDQTASSTPYVILAALSIHSIFEGIALGVQHDSAGVIALAVGIMAHKWAESLSLSIAFHENKQSREHSRAMLTFFTLVTPIGAIIGLVLNEMSTPFISGSAQALSGGTFVYIACSERFVEEFKPAQYRKRKFSAALIGAALIVGVGSFHSHE